MELNKNERTILEYSLGIFKEKFEDSATKDYDEETSIEHRIHDDELTNRHGHRECILFWFNYANIAIHVDFKSNRGEILFKIENCGHSDFYRHFISQENFTPVFLDYFVDLVDKYLHLYDEVSAMQTNIDNDEIPLSYYRKHSLETILNPK